MDGTLGWATLSLGLISGLHCAAMCGPLGGCFLRGQRGQDRPALIGYHLARLGAYSLAGALLGALGHGASSTWSGRGGAYVAWIAALWLLAQAAGVQPGSWGAAWLRPIAAWPPLLRGSALGGATALLPCGLLLSVYALSFASGGVVPGALAAAAFALGSLPPLLAGQIGLGALLARLPRRWSDLAQRGALLLAGVSLLYRGWSVASGAGCHGP